MIGDWSEHDFGMKIKPLLQFAFICQISTIRALLFKVCHAHV
jgi:hypothetical protein